MAEKGKRYMKEIEEWVYPDAKLIECWQQDEIADVCIFKNPDGTYDKIRAFKMGKKVAVSVDERNYKVPAPPTSDSRAIRHFKKKRT